MVTNSIRKYRKEQHLLQTDLVIGVQCDKQTISRYETGTREPSLEMALRLAKYLNIPTDELFTLEAAPITAKGVDPHE